MTAHETSKPATGYDAREYRLLQMVAKAPNGLLPIRRVTGATVGAAGLLIRREDAIALEEFAALSPPLMELDVERFFSAMGAIQTARAKLTDQGQLRLATLRAKQEGSSPE